LLTEDALWGIAWAHYRTGNCQKSLEVLTELNDKFPDPKYSYWKHRCSNYEENAASPTRKSEGVQPYMKDEDKPSTRAHPDWQQRENGSASSPYRKNDFYSLLAYMLDTGRLSRHAVTQAALASGIGQPSLSKTHPPADMLPYLERFDILMELDMKEDAIAELVNISKRLSRPDVVMYISRKLQEVGAYKRSISLVSRISNETDYYEGRRIFRSIDINDILYPLAYWQTVRAVSKQYQIDPFLLLSVMREESRFDPEARSVAGALGLMQIMPQTAYNLNSKLKMDISDRAEIFDVEINITLGAYYLGSLLKEFSSLPSAIAAYNAGEHKVREWLKGGKYISFDEFIEDIPYDETRNYVKRVLVTYARYLDMAGAQ
jgi:soluble lytic murein transglycosylase